MTDDSETRALVKAALLDKYGVYICMDELPKEELTEFHLPEITSCDLPSGKYRWNTERKCFVPLPKKTKADIEPDSQRAIALGFAALIAGRPCPLETIKWVEITLKSFDLNPDFDSTKGQ